VDTDEGATIDVLSKVSFVVAAHVVVAIFASIMALPLLTLDPSHILLGQFCMSAFLESVPCFSP
jgi:hypothetical protein